jgi:hypothetical protein
MQNSHKPDSWLIEDLEYRYKSQRLEIPSDLSHHQELKDSHYQNSFAVGFSRILSWLEKLSQVYDVDNRYREAKGVADNVAGKTISTRFYCTR